MKKCDGCGKNPVIDGDLIIPFSAHELAMARAERQVKRMWIALITCVCLIFASNALWFWAWMQYDYSGTYEEIIVEQDTQDGGNANYIGNDGDIVNGLSESDSTETNENSQEEEW